MGCRLEYLPDYYRCHRPTDLSSTNITNTSAQLNWKPSKSSYKYELQYKETDQNWTTITIQDASTSSYLLSGLKAKTTYNWRLESICSFGNSGFTNKLSFKTLASDKLSGDQSAFLSIYPNPAHNVLDIIYNGSNAVLSILNVSGQIVYIGTVTRNITDLNIGDWPRGIYLVRITGDQENQTQKFIIQ